MATYKRPWFGRLCRNGAGKYTPQYPYSRQMLESFEAFELFPLDGGGFFFTQEHIGGIDTERWLKALESGRLLRPWTPKAQRGKPGARIDWMAAYDDTKPSGYDFQTVEQHVWLHRLYFLLPLAQAFLRTGSNRWPRLWFQYFSQWSEAFPLPTGDDPESSPGRRYIWRDMQVAWRLVMLIHSVAMFGSRPNAFRPDEWAMIYRAIEEHTHRLHAEALRQIPKGGGMNHFLQKGTVLIYAGTLFPEFDDAAKWVATGRRIVRMHLSRHTYSDGGSVEACPSYSHFISRLYLDAHVLLEANAQLPVAGLRRSIERQYELLAQTASPNWRSLQLGDSYSLDAQRDLEIVGQLFPIQQTDRTSSVYYPASQFAVLRRGEAAVYVDAMPGGLWHIHRGKPNILAYYGGKPVLIDSGCVNYDKNAERDGWLKTRAAHNVVVVEPVKDDEAPGTSTTYSLTPVHVRKRTDDITARCVYRGEGTKYTWTRKVRLSDNTLEIEDRIKAGSPVDCVLHFHMARCRIAAYDGGFDAAGRGWRLACRCYDASGIGLRPSVERRLAVDDSNRRFQSPDVAFRQSGMTTVFRTKFHLNGGKARR